MGDEAEVAASHTEEAAADGALAPAPDAVPFGPLPLFYGGVAGLIGTPDPSTLTMEGMRDEHCASADTAIPFTAAERHGTTSTPLLEWWFVYDPELREAPEEATAALAEHRALLRLPPHRAWPAETRRAPPVDSRTGRVADGTWVPRRPESRMGTKLEERRRKVNAELRKVGEAAVTQEELIAARLYTGPMGSKYGIVLAALGAQKAWEANRVAEGSAVGGAAAAAIAAARAPLWEAYEARCAGNTYTTTLTTLAAVVGKLGRILRSPPTPLYLPIGSRGGDGGGGLPFDAGGGVSLGFLAATADRKAALGAASLSRSRRVLELRQGALDRGADLRWLSQYGEADAPLVLPPLTALELAGASYLSGVERLERQSGVGLVSMSGGEVEVVPADVKVAWPRAAAAPGRLKIAQLERARNGLEGKLAEAATKLSNLEHGFAELKAERDDLKRELVLRSAKLQRERQMNRATGRAGGVLSRRGLAASSVSMGDAEFSAEPPATDGGDAGGGGGGGATDETAAAAAAALREQSVVARLEAEKAQLEAALARKDSEARGAEARAAVAEARRLQAAAKEARHASYLERYQEEKMAYGYEAEELLAPVGGGGGAAGADDAAAHAWASAKDIVPPERIFVHGAAWHGGELARPAADPIAAFEATLVAPDPSDELRASMRDRADWASGVRPGARAGAPGGVRRAGGKHTLQRTGGAPGPLQPRGDGALQSSAPLKGWD